MHDFMYACAYYPDYLDWFCREAEKEAQYQTKRLAHHPCMAIWTGNNEIHESYTDWFTKETDPEYYYGFKIFNHIQPRAVHNNSPLIPYAPCSPFFGKNANDPTAGDVHAWGLMGKLQNPNNEPMNFEDMGKRPFRFDVFDELAKRIRFSSEYGSVGPTLRSSIERYHAGEPVSKTSASWINHETMMGMFALENMVIGGIRSSLAPVEDTDFDGYLLYGGIFEGILYKETMEAMRRVEQCSGTLIWMYDEAWPQTYSSTVDYYGSRKIAFYFLKRAFATKKFIIRVFDGKGSIVGLNETPRDLSVSIEYGYMSFDGKKANTKTAKVDLKRHSFNELPGFDAPGDLQKGFYYLTAGDQDFDAVTSLRAPYRTYDFAPFKAEIVSAKADGKDYLVTVKAETYVPFARLVCEDDRTRLSDNFMELIPGAEKTVRIANYGKKPELQLVPVAKSTAQ
jgi:beta-mannosidase